MIDELISPLLTTVWGQRTGLAWMIAATLLIVITFFQMIFTWHADMQLSHVPIHQTVHAAGMDPLTKLIQQIPDKHLFGKYDLAEVPITSLQLRLVGVIKGASSKESRVIISEANQPGKVYQVGDTLPSSGVKVYAITPDGVVLENAGHYEKLPLNRTPLQFQGMPKPLLGD